MFESSLIDSLLVKPPWQVETAQSEVASVGEILALSRMSSDSAKDAIRTARHDDISNCSRTFCWPPVWHPALAAIA
jgi:hypothetical protein